LALLPITIEVLVAMPMTRWEFRIVPWLAGGNASATCLKMLVMSFADEHCAMTCAFEFDPFHYVSSNAILSK